MNENTEYKSYLGDGVYARFDGYSIVLTTENGISVQNEIVLEPGILRSFEQYVSRLRAVLEAAGEER